MTEGVPRPHPDDKRFPLEMFGAATFDRLAELAEQSQIPERELFRAGLERFHASHARHAAGLRLAEQLRALPGHEQNRRAAVIAHCPGGRGVVRVFRVPAGLLAVPVGAGPWIGGRYSAWDNEPYWLDGSPRLVDYLTGRCHCHSKPQRVSTERLLYAARRGQKRIRAEV